MLKFEDLPKRPEEALFELLPELARLLMSTKKDLTSLRTANPTYYNKVFLQFMACTSVAGRVRDDRFREFASRSFENGMDLEPATLAERANNVLQALNVVMMDAHFIDNDEVAEFDDAELPEKERIEIRAALEQAKQIAEAATYLDTEHKRRILYRISAAENELFKEVAGFSAFLAMSYEMSRLIKQFGKDAQPLANAIETARTVTERHVEGSKELPSPDKPKRIEGPKDVS